MSRVRNRGERGRSLFDMLEGLVIGLFARQSFALLFTFIWLCVSSCRGLRGFSLEVEQAGVIQMMLDTITSGMDLRKELACVCMLCVRACVVCCARGCFSF